MSALSLGRIRRWLADRALVRNVHFDPARVAGITVELAETEGDLKAAARLVHDEFVRRGVMAAQPSGMKLHAHGLLPTSLTFVAKDGDVVIGTIALISDSPADLPMACTYRDTLDALRARGERLAEVSSLAVSKDARHTGVVYLLNRIMIQAAIARGIDRLVIAVHPRAESLYKTAMLFERIGSPRHYAGLNRSAAAVALGLRPCGLEERLRERYGHLGARAANAHHLYFAMDCPQIRQPDRASLEPTERRMDACAAVAREQIGLFRVLTPSVLAHFRAVLPGVVWPSPSSHDLARFVPVGLGIPQAGA